MTVLWIAAAILLFLLIAAIIAAYTTFHYAVSRKKDTQKINPSSIYAPYKEAMMQSVEAFLAASPEDVYIKSFDGLTLHGYYLPSEGSKKTVLLFHGYTSSALKDFSLIFRFYREQGFNILTADHRAHGKSEGKYMGFGVLERRDVLSWVEYLNSRAKQRIVLHGISMGASTVLMASGSPLPENVVGIVADCGFTSPYDILAHVGKQYFHLPAFPLLPLADIVCKQKAGYSFKEYSTLDAMKTNRLPVLFIHGEGDTFVPTSMSKAAYEACRAEKQLFLVPSAGHGLSYTVDPQKCEETLANFLQPLFEQTSDRLC
ncbi:MAG: alpha/beta hydrolase [Ruminococcaceae bacterium]|nr:alpha/beta hydrolase [Oscillospiraceae bacterium]